MGSARKAEAYATNCMSAIQQTGMTSYQRSKYQQAGGPLDRPGGDAGEEEGKRVRICHGLQAGTYAELQNSRIVCCFSLENPRLVPGENRARLLLNNNPRQAPARCKKEAMQGTGP